jgi:hypothetical protein
MTDREYIKEFISRHNIKSGDAIVTTFTGIGQAKHFFLVINDETFMQNSLHKNINRPSISEVAKMLKKFDRVERFKGEDYQRHYVIQRALQIEKEGRKYTLFFYNCHDFVNEASYGLAKSKQTETAGWFGLVGGLTLLTIGLGKNKKGLSIAGFVIAALSATVLLSRSSSQSKGLFNKK